MHGNQRKKRFNVFDFFFYTLYIAYEKKEKGGDSVWTASFAITQLYFAIIMSIVLFIDIFSDGVWALRNLNHGKVFLAIFIFGTALLCYFINLRKYKKQIDAIIARYKKHPATKWFRVWMFIVILEVVSLSFVLWAMIHEAIRS